MKVIYLDTETTGLIKPRAVALSAQPYIIDLGAVVVEDGTITRTVSQLVKPPIPVPPEITKITGITDAELTDAPTFSDVIPLLSEIFAGADYIVAHNAAFDLAVLGFELERANVKLDLPKAVCTVEEFTPIFGYKAKLTEVYEYVMGVTLDEKHRALSDATDLYKICAKVGIPA